MTVVDWRRVPAPQAAALLGAECDVWRDQLGWDLRSSWAAVEPARASGVLPGFVAMGDHDRPLGWTFFVRHRESVQVGALVASTDGVAGPLLDAIDASPDARGAALAIVFARDGAPDLGRALTARGFTVEPYLYLEAPAAAFADVSGPVAAWSPADHGAVVDLVARAYAPTTIVRPFAPEGRSSDWREYLDQIVTTAACGSFLPEASVTSVSPATGRLDGVVLTTAIDRQTAHLAQVAVDPAAQSRGHGRRLVGAAGALARRRGYVRVTLLVAAANAGARRVYARAGFRDTATFLAAVRRQPRSSTSAPIDGGARTLR